MTINYISAEEFQEQGYLQEVNRQFLHPLGLAMEVRREQDEDKFREWLDEWFHTVPDGPDHIDVALALLAHFGIIPGKVRFGGVWDYRDDPEGIYFGPDSGPDPVKAENIANQIAQRTDARVAALGYVVQPVDDNSEGG